MRYSLTSRIRGALVGGIIGQNLAVKNSKDELFYSQGLVRGMRSLIEKGGFDLSEWNQLQPQLWNSDVADDLVLFNLIAATLPLTIFFHENHRKLREKLLLSIKKYNQPLLQDGILTVSYIIAQSLNEKINQDTLVSEITSFIGETKTHLPAKLHQVNNLIAENTGYSELQNCLDKENNTSNIIAEVFYCFATTKEDFRLTCLRAIKNHCNSKVSGTIAGVISGAYNSMAGIPITWHLGLDEAKLAQWGITSFSEMVKLADALVSVWSGIYCPLPQIMEIKEVDPDLVSPLEAIAAPYIIRLR